MLFSIHAYSAPLYVKLESDGDLIFSNTPIVNTKPDTLPKNKPIVAVVTKENKNNTHNSKVNTKPMITEATKKSENVNNIPNSNVIPVSLPNSIPTIAAITDENIAITHKSNIKPATLPKNKSIVATDTKENINNTHDSKANTKPIITEATKKSKNLNNMHNSNALPISLPNNIPIIATVTEENIPITYKADTHTKPMIAEVTEKNINITHEPNIKAKAIIRPKNKSIIVEMTEENIKKTHKDKAKTKLATLPKNKLVIAKVTKENINKTHQSNAINTQLKYKTFHITSPLNKEVLQDLLVDFKIEPKLQHDHKILLFIDGKRINKPSSSTHINTEVTKKGSHEIYGLIIDKNKNFVMQSNVITIYIRQASMKTTHTIQADHHKISKQSPIRKVSVANNR